MDFSISELSDVDTLIEVSCFTLFLSPT